MAADLEGRRSSLEGAFVAIGFVALAIVSIGVGLRTQFPPLASKHGAGIDAMLQFLLVATGAMFLAGHLALAYFVFHGTRRDRILHRLASTKSERVIAISLGLLMSLIAEGGVLVIGLPAWAEYFAAEVPTDVPTIEVTPQQFAWNVRYPGPDGVFGRTRVDLVDDATNPLGLDFADPAARDDIVLINHVYMPRDRMVRIVLHAKDVIHSFFVPALRVKQDAVPGMRPEVVFTPTAAGDFDLLCTELCGLGHYRMQGMVHVLDPEAYESWLAEQRPAFEQQDEL